MRRIIIRGVWLCLLVFVSARLVGAVENNASAVSSLLKITQEKPGNIFLGNEPVRFKLSIGADSIRWEVSDFWGKKVAEGKEKTEKDKAFSLSLPFNKKGYFTLKVTAEESNGKTKEISTPFAVLSDFDVKKVVSSPFGVNTHFEDVSGRWNPDELIPLLSAAGIKNIRDGVRWWAVEQTKGKLSLPKEHEYFLDKLNQASLTPLITVLAGNKDYCEGAFSLREGGFPVSDTAVAGFARFAGEVAKRTTGRVEYFEVWNEWSNNIWTKHKEDSSPENYAKLLKAAYPSIKAANPQATVVGIGGENTGVSIQDGFVTMPRMFQAGALKACDAASIHPYCYPASPEIRRFTEKLEKVKEMIKKYGGNQPVWITEIGWPNHIDFTHLGVSEEIQAKFLVRCYVLALSEGVAKIYWYDFKDEGTAKTDVEQNCGLIRNQEDSLGKYTPKPSYVSYAVLIRQLTGAKFVTKEGSEGNIQDYLFRKENKDIRVLWALNPINVTLETDNPIKITDLMGEEETLHPVAGKVCLTLTSDPIYQEGNVKGITKKEN